MAEYYRIVPCAIADFGLVIAHSRIVAPSSAKQHAEMPTPVDIIHSYVTAEGCVHNCDNIGYAYLSDFFYYSSVHFYRSGSMRCTAEGAEERRGFNIATASSVPPVVSTLPMELNQISGQVVDAAMKVHTALGPGLLESAYEICLTHELRKRGLNVRTQVVLPVAYDGIELDAGYRLDLLVEDAVIVELKAVAKLLPIHEAQLLSYLKLSGCKLGLLINFHVLHLKEGIKRIANKL